jgi:peptide/nickel transport system substrate-binding protein
MALDLGQVTKVATTGLGQAATGLIAETPKPCSGNTVTGTLPAHNPAQAATVLDQAGWIKGSDGNRSKDGKPLKINLHYVTTQGDSGTATAELIAQQWNAIGVQVTLTGDDANGLNAAMFQTGNFDAYWDGFGFNLPTQVVPFVSGPQPPQGQNFVGIDNTAYERLAAQALAQAAPQACTLWNQAEQALFRNLDVVPVADATLPTFLDKAQMRLSDGVVVPTSIRVLR